ncbi:UNVERIFIED_CONTAM: spore germination protein KC [Acetivibrio alkalicellulosi]
MPVVSQNGDDMETSSKEQSNMDSLTIDAPSFFSAIQLANSILPRELNLMHAQAVVFSEEVATSGKVGEFIVPIVRYRQLRFNVLVAVSKGTAQELVENFSPYTGSNISRTIKGIIKKDTNIGYYLTSTLHDFYDCLKSTYHQPILLYTAINKGENFIESSENENNGFSISGNFYAGDIPKKGGSNLEFLGLAVFEGDTMVGKLSGHQTSLFSMVKGNLKKTVYTIKDPQEPDLVIPISTALKSPPVIKVSFDGLKPIINAKIDLEGNIISIQSRINYEDPKIKSVIEDALSQFILTELEKVFYKTLEWNCDIFQFGHIAVRNFRTIDEWEKYNWNNNYKNSQISANVNVEIVRTGKMLDSSPIIMSGEKND